ncbi:hydantoinase/oxoprolinase family protein [Paraburkholderia rhizosphaerae]|uniref:Putative H4MPT-linked C1 transfer pathway protein n=1 Tax=Paraburkholderia rhizosphaerae TaxID=480658 RepID=A0A4R8LWX0_9BURK|nr:hydantoinase/oxoprolinase family protein [Paraburkholderia rhizosphaerae]TDY52152.1 putative H4MPT-linked C1 transfer pathway protein [Paraburkholderia rhizosphaerae]
MSGSRDSSFDTCAVFGWDVGGAHVKVSVVDASGVLVDVAQWACPLWQGLAHLERVVDEVFARWPDAFMRGSHHAVTMTGEMVDLFDDREQGVRVLVQTLAVRLGDSVRFFAGAQRWLSPADAITQWRAVASANWLATSQWVATQRPNALLIDIGSTTTDIVPIVDARVAARGSNDATRLISGELVYQGVVRTPLCGVAHRIAFRGETSAVMNEWFATSADIYRLTGELWAPHDQHASADNGPKTVDASCARLARMIGRDAADASTDEWRAFAQRWRFEQLRAIGAGVAQVLEAHPALADAPLVGAGCGRFLVVDLACSIERAYVDFSELARGARSAQAHTRANTETNTDTLELNEWIATCAPSVAVAQLMAADTARGASETGAPAVEPARAA